MINSAFTDWSVNPVITTLDSIAAPIDGIQFPTVTVCADDNDKPSDNWAFLENILNVLMFSCHQNYNDCNETEHLRKDFSFLMENIVNIYDDIGFVTEYDAMNMHLIPNGTFHKYLSPSDKSDMDPLLWQVKEWTSNKTISYYQLRDLAIDNYSKWLSFSDIYKILSNESNANKLSFVQHFTNCSSYDECRNVFLVKVMYELTSMKQGFGHLVRNFAHLDSSNSFSMTKKVNEALDEFWGDENCLFKLTPNEKKLHQYFTELARFIGFNESEVISLYDLPAIFNSAISNLERWPPLMPQSFFYTKCRHHDETVEQQTLSYMTPGLFDEYFDYKMSCSKQWERYIDTLSGLYKFIISKLRIFCLY